MQLFVIALCAGGQPLNRKITKMVLRVNVVISLKLINENHTCSLLTTGKHCGN